MQQPVWPSVEQQLAQVNVVPGSALEQLIRNNQDFHLLRPEEANDKIRLPLWLRVYWHKQHPELIYSANDPTGGYPLALKDVYAWMLTHQDLRPSPPPSPAEPTDSVDSSVPSAVAPRVAIGSNRRISGAQTTPRSESDIRVNYHNSDKIIAASNDIGGWQKQFYSRDGGTTWSQTSLIPVLKDTQQTDPTVDWTSDGTAWAITIGIELRPEDGGGGKGDGGAKELLFSLRAYRSSDSGATWAFDATISGSQTAPDKEMMWVDHSPTSPFKDNIYVIWHNDTPAFVARRTEGAWQAPPVQVSGPETTGTALGGDIKTNSAGDVFAFWPDMGSRKLLVAKSTNGGVKFSSPNAITTTFASNAISVPSFRGALIYLSGGAYHTATKDLVYATWVDLTGALGCTTNERGPSDNEPGTNVSSTCKTRIWFSRSTDGGTTWESPRMINNQASLNDQFHPRLAVDEINGHLLIVYYDTMSDLGRKKTDVWLQSSSDDGVTWSIPIKITTAQTDETGNGANAIQYGDYISLSGYAGGFSASWTDRRNGGMEEIWTADILVPPPYPLRRFLRRKGIDPSKGLRSIRPPLTSLKAFMGI